MKLRTDGGLKTGRDIVIAAILGAEEFGIGTLSLVAQVTYCYLYFLWLSAVFGMQLFGGSVTARRCSVCVLGGSDGRVTGFNDAAASVAACAAACDAPGAALLLRCARECAEFHRRAWPRGSEIVGWPDHFGRTSTATSRTRTS